MIVRRRIEASTSQTMAKVKKSTYLVWAVLVCQPLDWRETAVRKHKDEVRIWPAYLDSNLSRGQGRRIPVNLAAPDVTVDVLAEAAAAAGLESEVENDKQYPRNWSGIGGSVLLSNPEGHKKKRSSDARKGRSQNRGPARIRQAGRRSEESRKEAPKVVTVKWSDND